MPTLGSDNSFYSGGVAPRPLPPAARLTPSERLESQNKREEEEEENSFLTHNPLTRGVAGAIEGFLEIPRIFGDDAPLAHDFEDNFGLGHSTSTVGSLVEGSVQFLTGFLIPGTFGLGHVGKVGKATKTAKAISAARKARAAKAVAAGDKSYDAAKYARVRAQEILQRAGLSEGKAATAVRRYGFGRSMGVGAFADATAFTHDELRLSNMLKHFGADNAVVNFLATNPDDEAAVGRFKNLLEGAGLGLAVEGLTVIARGVFRRKKILEDPTLTKKQKEDKLTDDLVESGEAADDVTTSGALEEGGVPRPEADVPAAADIDGDLSQMSFKQLQEEAKKHSGVKRGGKGINKDTLQRDISDARRAAGEQTERSRAFDDEQFPNRGATETSEEAAARREQGLPVPLRDSEVPHLSDETQLQIKDQEAGMADEFGPDWDQVEKQVKTWTEVDPVTGAKKKRQKTSWVYRDEPNRPVEPALVSAINKRNKLTVDMLNQRRTEILIGDRPKSDLAKTFGEVWTDLPHHENLRTLADSLVRNKEIPKQKVLQIIGSLDSQLKSGEFTPEQIHGVVNTAMLGPESFSELVKISVEHGVIKPAHMADANGKNLGYHTVEVKVRDPKTGNMVTKQKVINELGETVKDTELQKIRIRVLANQTGASMKQIQAKLNRHSKNMDDITHDAQALSSFISAHLRHAKELFEAMDPRNIELRKKLGLEDSTGAEVAFARWLQNGAPMIESWGRYRRGVSRGFYMMRYGADQIFEPGALRAMLDELGGPNHIRDLGHKLFGPGGALESGGISGASSALRTIDRNQRVWWMINEHFVNFVLSGIRTFSTNTIGNTMTAVYGPLENMLAARAKQGFLTMTGNRSEELQQEVLRATQEFFGIWGQISDAAAFGKKAWDEQDYILSPGKGGTLDIPKGQQNAWTPENWAGIRGQEPKPEGWTVQGGMLDPESSATEFMGQRFMELWGPILRTPSRALMATDEFFLQLNYRSAVRADMIVEAHALKKAGKLRSGTDQAGKDLSGPELQSVDDWVAEEMTAMTARGQALIKDNLTREADRRFNIDMKNEDGTARFMHADGHIALAMAKRNWIEQQLRGGLANRGAIGERGMAVARERTFTAELDPEKGFLSDMGKTLSSFSTRHPSVRLFVPFIRTPLNIFVYASRRTAIPVLNKDILGAAEYLRGYKLEGKGIEGMKSQMARELASPDHRIRNEAHARMMGSVGWLFGVLTAANSGILTGAGPADKDMRKVMQNAGWQPYSIKVGDTYISYQKADPIATVLGLYADMGDASKWATEEDQHDLERLMVSASISIAHNMKSKSYLQGLTNLAGIINDPEMSVPAVGGRMLGAFAVPSFVAGFRELSDDSYVEMRGVLDGLRSRVPGWSTASLDPMRNAIGEKVDRRQFEGAWETFNDINALMAPLLTNRTTSDQITKEFAKLEYPFSTPSRFKFGADLTDHKNDKDQSAFDRWLELSGTINNYHVGNRTLRQSLTRLINSRAYKSLPEEGLQQVDVESPRIALIMTVIQNYRSVAMYEMLQEFPELGELARNQAITRSAIKQGVDPGLIKDQLFPVE